MQAMDIPALTLEGLSQFHHELIDELRANGPVSWVPALDAWFVVSRPLAVEVMRDAERFTVDDPRFSTAQVIGASMLSLDGDEHRRRRAPFVAAFRPSDLGHRLGPMIEERPRHLVDTIVPHGHADLTAAIAGPLAAFSASAALGLDHLDPDVLLSWYRQIVAETEQISLGGDHHGGAAPAVEALGAAVRAAALDPTNALHTISAHLDDTDLVANAAVFLFGGIETTEGMIANLFMHLLSDPAALRAVDADRSLVDAAIEESLRLEPSVARVDRYATRDVILAGHVISAGDFVVVSLSAANRDPAVYASPHAFRLDRAGGPAHLAFVQGPHTCIGAYLARFEARSALVAVLDALPGLELVPGHAAAADGVVFRKARSLPARWRTPAPGS
jgi:cytochrome P450